MRALELFPPSLVLAKARNESVNPWSYARSRNAIEGAVSRLSPYITHGFLSLSNVLANVANKHAVNFENKFVSELGWREYFQHVWRHKGDAIFDSLHAGPVPERVYSLALPADVRYAHTGVPVIDMAVKSLYSDGYLHNHARLWLASYLVHIRKVHWRVGADWMYGHLLDGDLASNHLSWQWVAGTGSRKPYLFNAQNVSKYAPANWHSPGSVIDETYSTLEHYAYLPVPVPVVHRHGLSGVDEPRLRQSPAGLSGIDASKIAGKDVWVVHPWALDDPPGDWPADGVVLGWWPDEFFSGWRWNESRFEFVSQRMAQVCHLQWHGCSTELHQAVSSARSVQTQSNLHMDPHMPMSITKRRPTSLFEEVPMPCDSFTSWWKKSTRGCRTVNELPGLIARGSSVVPSIAGKLDF